MGYDEASPDGLSRMLDVSRRSGSGGIQIDGARGRRAVFVYGEADLHDYQFASLCPREKLLIIS